MRIATLYLLLFFAFSHAYFGKENEALAVFGWALLLQSPRTVALEGAGSAYQSKDFGAALMNPALLEGKGIGAGFSWQSGDFADNQGIAAISHSLSIFGIEGRIQHTYGIVDNGEVPHLDESGEETGITSYPLAQYYAITAAVPLKHFKVGITGRYLWDRLSEIDGAQVGMALAMDWGLLWNSNSTRYGFALMGRHLGAQFRPYVRGGVNGYALASELAAGTFWRANQDLTWLLECSAPRYSPATGKLGMEYRFSDPLFIRAGMQRDLIDVARFVRSFFDSDEKSTKVGYHRLFSAGVGYRFWNLALDYSYSMLIEGMGSEHRVGLSGAF
ncbi:MAG: hypothetical protein LBQ87_01070 [Candidatus Fibromonas sp.]|jgi:hypothetical protein|nr:hypothetical protein [Candidatus Fibromonas sp.]